jgi:hypothetical protein
LLHVLKIQETILCIADSHSTFFFQCFCKKLFQFGIDLPIAQNGALQRAKALEQVRDICHQLAMDFATAGHLRGQ